MKKTDYMILIHKSLSGAIDPKEDEQLQQWLKDPAHESIFQEVKMIWESAEEELEPMTEEKKKIERAKLLARLGEVKKQESQFHGYRKRIRLRNLIISVMIFLTGFLFYITVNRTAGIPETTTIAIDDQNKAILSDSSVVLLKEGSTVSFRRSTLERVVNLSGEAYFEVTEDKASPFIIHAGGATIKVTGTSFVVRAYPGEPLQVIVISGHVEVIHNGNTVKLSEKNDMAVLREKLYKTVNDDPNFNSWYTQKLSFDKTKLKKILGLLASRFDVTFEIENKKLLDCRFSGRFQNEDGLEAILNVLSFSLDITFKEHGTTYKIHGTGCKGMINQ